MLRLAGRKVGQHISITPRLTPALDPMGRTCGSSLHRKQLLASEIAACFHCFAEFPPTTVRDWTDGELPGATAICPHCGIDAVVGFNGSVDVAWLKAAYQRGFG